MDIKSTEAVIMTETGRECIVWVCRKCGQLRSNRHTHKHFVPLPDEVIETYEKSKAEKQGECAEPRGTGTAD